MNASNAYAKQQALIEARLQALKTRLEMHAVQQQRDNKNWGLVGDLERINHLLAECLGEE